MEIPPGPGILQSIRRATVSWPEALGELIDNSFDAGAMNVALLFGPKNRLQITDDGAGCNSIEKMLTLGSHYRQPTTRLGRYGVGLKDAACWMWGKLVIETVSGDQAYYANVDWAELSRRNDWYIPDPIVKPKADRRGTTLTFAGIERGLPRDYGRLCDELSYTFTPGLLKGYQIRFEFPKRKPILAKPYTLPPLEDIVEDTLDVCGRGIRLHVGIVKEGHPNFKPGFAFCHHHRVIMTNAVGAGDMSTARIAGQVFLDDSWHLSVHKNDIDSKQAELGDAIFYRCKELLQRAQMQARVISSQMFTDRLNQKLKNALYSLAKKDKEKRDPPENNSGSVSPKDSGRKRTKASKRQPGNSLLSEEQIGRLRLEWRPFQLETLGEVDEKGARIWLNQANAHLDGLRREENDSAILAIAIGMYVNKAVMSGNMQMYFPGWKYDPEKCAGFLSTWATVLNNVTGIDG